MSKQQLLDALRKYREEYEIPPHMDVVFAWLAAMLVKEIRDEPEST